MFEPFRFDLYLYKLQLGPYSIDLLSPWAQSNAVVSGSSYCAVTGSIELLCSYGIDRAGAAVTGSIELLCSDGFDRAGAAVTRSIELLCSDGIDRATVQ
ncbi:unnamed protein product [Microthlaspi erraticum]|uniref:Uncharacterized protein n=1 Tax=Microthlaspi erraticum TaxID=1685480 RepID=A0A6D2JBA9_9BRAS|nr:unnamed protein product [Microthlaspi erraticum]